MEFAGLELSALLGFALTCAVIELTPGPNMGYLAVLSLSEGRRAGYAAVAGVALGLAIVGIAAALGLAAVIAASPWLFQSLRWAGVIYLLWLAIEGWRDAGEGNAEPLGLELAKYFRRGLVTNLLNPKAGLFYVAVLPGFVMASAQVVSQTVTLSLVFVAIATAIHAGIVTLAGSARAFLGDARRIRITRRVLSVLLGLIALWFAWETRG